MVRPMLMIRNVWATMTNGPMHRKYFVPICVFFGLLGFAYYVIHATFST
jgi:hypothetical protein